MIRFLSIFLWNAERPRYPGILFLDRIYPSMRGAPTAGSSFHYDLVYDGISASLQHADLHGLSECFSCFYLGKDCVGNWLRVAGTSG